MMVARAIFKGVQGQHGCGACSMVAAGVAGGWWEQEGGMGGMAVIGRLRQSRRCMIRGLGALLRESRRPGGGESLAKGVLEKRVAAPGGGCAAVLAAGVCASPGYVRKKGMRGAGRACLESNRRSVLEEVIPKEVERSC